MIKDTGSGVTSGVEIVVSVGSAAPYRIVKVNSVLVPERTAVLVVVSIGISASVICPAPMGAGIVRVAEVMIVLSWLLSGQ